MVGVVFVILAVLVGVLTPLMMKMAERRASGERTYKAAGTKTRGGKKKFDLKEIWDIEDIKNDVVVLTGGRYRALVRMGSVDYHLMSEPEQHSVESALMSLSLALGFPVQTLVTTEMVDAKQLIAEIYGNAGGDAPAELKKYAAHMAQYLESIMQDRAVYSRRSYAVVFNDTAEPAARARSELMRRAGVLAESLSRAGVTAELLKTGEIVDLLHGMLNRGRTARPSELVAAGGMELYHV